MDVKLASLKSALTFKEICAAEVGKFETRPVADCMTKVGASKVSALEVRVVETGAGSSRRAARDGIGLVLRGGVAKREEFHRSSQHDLVRTGGSQAVLCGVPEDH